MPRHDPDIIAALAEGRLDPDEAVAIAREIAADPVAAAELADHRAALDAMSSAPRVELTEAERTDLRAAVADALGLVEPEPAAVSVSRHVPWGSIGIAAAALAALIAVVPVAGLLTTGGGDEGAALELAAEAPTTLTDAAPEAKDAAVEDEAAAPVVGEIETDDALVSGAEAGSDVAGFGSSTTRATTTTTRAPTTTTTATSEAVQESTTTITTAAAAATEGVDRLAEELGAIKADPAAVDVLAAVAAQEDSCYVEDTGVRGDPPPDRFRFVYENGELTVIVYFERDNGDIGPFQVWGVPDCANLVVIP